MACDMSAEISRCRRLSRFRRRPSQLVPGNFVRRGLITHRLRFAPCAPLRAIWAVDRVAAGRHRPNGAVDTRERSLPRLGKRCTRTRRSECDASLSHGQGGHLLRGERAPARDRPNVRLPDCRWCGHRGGSAARRASPGGMLEGARIDSSVPSGPGHVKVGTAVDLLGYAAGETEPRAKGEAPAGLVVCTWLTRRHEVLFGRHRRFDRHKPR